EEGVGAIGEAVTEDIFTWVKVQADVPSVEEVAANPATALLPSRPDAIVLVTYMLVHGATSKNIAALCSYVERLPPEFVVTFVTALGKRNRQLLVNPAVVKKLTSKNAALVNAIAAL